MCGVRPSRMYSATVSAGGVSGFCGTRATLRAICLRVFESTARPSSCTEPANGTRPAIARRIVVFPAPLGPMSATHSPCSTAAPTPCTTSARPRVTQRPSIRTAVTT